jgi:hypothetical protein
MNYNIKRLSDYSDESLLNELRRVAEKLGKDTLTKEKYDQIARTSSETIVRRFGSWNSALNKARLLESKRMSISDKDLFIEIDSLWGQLGRQPTISDIKDIGKFSVRPYVRRFGSWLKALEEFAKWKNKEQGNTTKDLEETALDVSLNQPRKQRGTRRVEYGEPIEFLGLRHSPLNEQGVVYLFGILSKQLGFIIEAVRTDFPDCEGKRQIPGKQGRWEQVSIEFEYKSSNFKEHRHNPDECDVIVCWEHDWKDCPIEVISLKELMSKIKERKE